MSGSYPHAQQFYYAVGRGHLEKDAAELAREGDFDVENLDPRTESKKNRSKVSKGKTGGKQGGKIVFGAGSGGARGGVVGIGGGSGARQSLSLDDYDDHEHDAEDTWRLLPAKSTATYPPPPRTPAVPPPTTSSTAANALDPASPNRLSKSNLAALDSTQQPLKRLDLLDKQQQNVEPIVSPLHAAAPLAPPPPVPSTASKATSVIKERKPTDYSSSSTTTATAQETKKAAITSSATSSTAVITQPPSSEVPPIPSRPPTADENQEDDEDDVDAADEDSAALFRQLQPSLPLPTDDSATRVTARDLLLRQSHHTSDLQQEHARDEDVFEGEAEVVEEVEEDAVLVEVPSAQTKTQKNNKKNKKKNNSTNNSNSNSSSDNHDKKPEKPARAPK